MRVIVGVPARPFFLFKQPDNKSRSDTDISIMVNANGTPKTVSGDVCPTWIMLKMKITIRWIKQ